MKRETLLTISVVILLLLNIGVLSYMFLERQSCPPPPGPMPPPPPPGAMMPPPMRPDMLIRQTLKLSEEQDKKYVASIEVHHSGMVRLDSEYRVVAEEYFKLLQTKNSTAAATGDSLVKKLGAIQAEKASITYRHLEEIKAMCSAEQAAKFDTIIPEIVRMLLMPPNRMPPDHGFPPPPPRRK